MTIQPTESDVRLVIGCVLNIVLWFVFRQMALFSNVEREFRFAFIGGCLAGITIVCLVPIFWKGRPWQAPIAFVLLWLPVLVLWGVFLSAVRYR